MDHKPRLGGQLGASDREAICLEWRACEPNIILLKLKRSFCLLVYLIQDIFHRSVRLRADMVGEDCSDLKYKFYQRSFDTAVNASEREFCKNFMISYQKNSFYLLGNFRMKSHFIKGKSSSMSCMP